MVSGDMGSGIAAVLLGGFLNGSFVVPMRNVS